MPPRNEAWAGRRVLVTGHNGFKGTWLAAWLREMGAHVFGLSLPPEPGPSLHEALGLDRHDGVCDVRDGAAVQLAVATARPHVIFHLAAQPLVRRGYAEPVDTFDVNVMGTARVLDAARWVDSVRAVVVVTSDKIYAEDADARPYTESARVGGADPYSASKGCAELVTASFQESFLAERGVRTATVRAGNVIGGGDWSQDRLVPDVVRAWLDQEPLVLRFPQATRPWQHVLDPLHGYILLAEGLLDGSAESLKALNFGPEPEASIAVGELVDQLSVRFEGGVRVVREPAGQPREADGLTLSSDLAKQLLGWRPVLDLEVALDWTAEWYLAHARGQDVAGLTRDQIHRFVQRASGAGAHDAHATRRAT